jgi:hypothetical protein
MLPTQSGSGNRLNRVSGAWLVAELIPALAAYLPRISGDIVWLYMVIFHPLIIPTSNYAGATLIELTKQEWNPVWSQIKQDYPRSVWMISYVLKRELGFTVRKHQKQSTFNWEFDIDDQGGVTLPTVICLDFYDEQMEVYFRLKYL